MATKVDNYHCFKGRELDIKKKVHVYRNLHGGKGYRYSLKQDGLVVGHTSRINLKECYFVVNESGRQRVLKTRRKNVHAYVIGYPVLITLDRDLVKYGPAREGKYNPYENDHFMVRESDGSWTPVIASMRAELGPGGLSIWMPRA